MGNRIDFMVNTKGLRKAAFAIAFGATMGKFVGDFCGEVICRTGIKFLSRMIESMENDDKSEE